MLNKLHDELDAAVSQLTFGRMISPTSASSNDLALNCERAEEERRGLVRRLRPDLQNVAAAKPILPDPAESAVPSLGGAAAWLRRRSFPSRLQG